MTSSFQRSDGRLISIVPGFRERVLAERPSNTPRADWTAARYGEVARKRLAGARRRWSDLRPFAAPDELRRGLELGCGAGLDCVLAGADGMPSVLGIDRDPSALATGQRGDDARRLVSEAAREAGYDVSGWASGLPQGVDIQAMDATALELEDSSVDLVWSRTVLEHVVPLQPALDEAARVLRPGGLAHHVIDPFFSLKGCHARGLTDIPWAHARLAGDEFARAVRAAESRRRSVVRAEWLRTLNALTLKEWRLLLLAGEEFDLLLWRAEPLPLAEQLLDEHTDVEPTALPDVTRGDLTCASITAVLRRR